MRTFRLAPLALMFGKDRNLDRIPIVRVVRRELVVPTKLSRVGIDGNHRSGVKIVPPTHIAEQIRTGISGSPVEQVQLGTVRSSEPRRTAAMLPGIAGPGLTTG